MIWPFSKERNSTTDAQAERLRKVSTLVEHLGFELTPYGVALALLSLESGYSVEETSSHIAVVSIAKEISKTRDIVKLNALLALGLAILENLKVFKDTGLMRLEIWENDSTAISKMIFTGPETSEWVDKILSDPMVAEDVLATTLIFRGQESRDD